MMMMMKVVVDDDDYDEGSYDRDDDRDTSVGGCEKQIMSIPQHL